MTVRSADGRGRCGFSPLRFGKQPCGAADERLGAEGFADRAQGRGVDSIDQRQGHALFAGGGDAGTDRRGPGGDDLVRNQRDAAGQPFRQSMVQVRDQLPVLEQMALEQSAAINGMGEARRHETALRGNGHVQQWRQGIEIRRGSLVAEREEADGGALQKGARGVRRQNGGGRRDDLSLA